MAGELLVRPGVIEKAAADVSAIGRAIKSARTYLNTHVQCDFDGGQWVTDAGELINYLPRVLDEPYGDYVREVGQGGNELRSIAKDYRRTDRSEWRRYDRLNRKVEPDELTLDDTVLQVDPGFSDADAKSLLPDPSHAYETGGRQQWEDIKDKVEKIASFGEQISPITALGIKNPFATWAEDWGGTWDQIGISVDAIRNLGHFWMRLAGEAEATSRRFTGSWEGRASQAVTSWLLSLATNCDNHGEALLDKSDEIYAKGALMNDVLDPLLELGADLVDIVASVADLGGDVWDVVKNPLKVVGILSDSAEKALKLVAKITGLVEHILRVIDLVILVGDLVMAAFEDLTAHDVHLYVFFSADALESIEVGP